jgi:hypothetical protein
MQMSVTFNTDSTEEMQLFFSVMHEPMSRLKAAFAALLAPPAQQGHQQLAKPNQTPAVEPEAPVEPIAPDHFGFPTEAPPAAAPATRKTRGPGKKGSEALLSQGRDKVEAPVAPPAAAEPAPEAPPAAPVKVTVDLLRDAIDKVIKKHGKPTRVIEILGAYGATKLLGDKPLPLDKYEVAYALLRAELSPKPKSLIDDEIPF